MERRTTLIDIYAYPDAGWSTRNLSGFEIEATDGGIGKVDERSNEIGSGYLVVDTGPWIFGKQVVIPAGVISRIDQDAHRVWVNLTKDEIKNAPEVEYDGVFDDSHREQLRTYYGERVDSMNRPAGPDFGSDDRGF